MTLDGAKILVTGASSGIGAELAPLLAERGATVGVVARRRERLEAVRERCDGRARGARLWAADLGEPGLPERVVREAWQAFGHLDCVVANAAIPAMEGEGFEYYVPPVYPNGVDARAMVVSKHENCDQYVQTLATVARSLRT